MLLHGEQCKDPLARLEKAIRTAEKAWSGSNMGYQSRVYYAELAVPPPGAHFDSEWRFLGQFQGTTGDWREFNADDLIQVIHERAEVEPVDRAATGADEAHSVWTNARAEIVSIFSAYVMQRDDPLVER